MKNAADTAVLYVSPAYETIWGRTREGLYDQSHTFIDSVHPDDRARVNEAMNAKHENEGYEEEYRIIRPDGETRWIFARSYPVRDDGGVIRRYAGIAEDITERKRAEKECSRLAAIIEFADDAIMNITLEGNIITWNRGAERKYGYSAEEVIGHSIIKLIPPEHRAEYRNTLAKVRKGESVASYPTVRQHKDGSIINLSIALSPIEAIDGEIVGISKISQDISRVKTLEAQIIEAQKMDVIAQLTAGVTHDFNNILSVVLGYSEMMISDLAPDSHLLRSVEGIRHAALRGGGLTRQLLVFSRKEAVLPVVLDLNEITGNIEDMLRRLIDENIELTLTRGARIGRFKADQGHVEQVVLNLVINARDAMPEGGKISVVTSDISVSENDTLRHPGVPVGHYVSLRITDTGSGMTDETKARLFQPFFTTKPKDKGTGLGLTTCQMIVKQSGGYIAVSSELEKGTTFEVYFPRLAESAETTPTLQPWPLSRGTEKILVVEDDLAVRQLNCMVLKNQGYEVVSATNGDEALRIVLNDRGPKISLVISDVVMPGMGGQAMAKKLEETNPFLKILFTSGYTEDTIVSHGGLQQGVAFLSKPYTVATLSRRVRELLDEAPACRMASE